MADKGNTLLFTRYGGMVVEDPNLDIYRRAVAMARKKTPFRRKGKTYSMNMWLKVPEGKEGDVRSVAREERSEEGVDGEKEMQRMLTMAAENGWKIAGWRGKGGKEWRPTFGRPGR